MHLRLLAIIMTCLLWSGDAHALNCSFSNTGVNFGNVNLTSGGFQSATGTFSAECSGNPGQTVLICPNFNDGSGGIHPSGNPRYMTQGPARLRYDLFSSNGVGQPWGSHTWGYTSRPPTLRVTLNGNGFGSTSRAIFGRLYNQQGALPTGTFSSNFAGSNTQIDYGYSGSFSCGSSLSPRVQNAPFIVVTTNSSSCTVTASNLNFGNQTSLDSPISATNSITATCTAGTQFEIGLSNGTSGATNPAARRMTNPANAEDIQYGIYRDGGRTQPWGNSTGANTISAVGTGSPQSFTGYGIVPPQPTPGAQVYSDTVVVVVTY